MMNTILIALVLGLIAAVVFVSATTGPMPVRLILFLITPLPLLLAGLGWGAQAALIAAFAGTALLLALAGPAVAAVFAASQAVPAAILSYLALLNRPLASSDPANGANPADTKTAMIPREWYPPGRLVVWTAVLAAVPAAIWCVIADFDKERLKDMLEKALTEAFKAGAATAPSGIPLSADDIAKVTSVIYQMLPPGSAIAWMGGLITALWLAGRVMLASGQLSRPWPDLSAMEFPAGTALVFAAALIVSFVDGPIGIAARAFGGAFLLAYVLLGLAIFHFITRGNAWRSFILWGLYVTLLVLSAYAAIPLALLGLSDRFLNLRNRFGHPASGP